MKSMNDRKMDMSPGGPKSEGFFPERPHSRELRKAGEIRGIKYPDTEEDIHADQEQAIRASDKARQKEGFRH
jgi:hypothetical protein